ncbi:MAG TPA: alpha/beta hydrolase [Candidatus Dormibacteraeota bacterium]|nr:alpha/beta hydrolase [Candidatus Dormibacteraeota bacterium]
MSALIGPTSHYFYSQRLKLHYVDWGNAEKPPLLLIHGGRDHARNWDWVAEDLRRDFHIIAPDLRGHGDSQWAVGGSYAMVDYTLDVDQLLRALDIEQITVIGHSLGGSIALQYAGTYPDRVKTVVAIEGLGPPPELLREQPPAHQRMKVWIGEMRALARRHPHRYATLDEAVVRMQEANPRLTPAQARHLTVYGSYRDEDGTYLWKFDNYVRATSPYLFNMTDAADIWTQITCPVLLLRGTESCASDPEIDGRAKAFKDYTFFNIEKAGHWVHHDQLGEVLSHVRTFLGGSS